MSEETTNRPLTLHERRLMRWMLENGTPEAKQFLGQLEQARATSWKCECGCASVNLAIQGFPSPEGGMQVLADFVFDDGMSGIFLYHQGGVLSGLEVCGYAADAAKLLPDPEALQVIT